MKLSYVAIVAILVTIIVLVALNREQFRVSKGGSRSSGGGGRSRGPRIQSVVGRDKSSW